MSTWSTLPVTSPEEQRKLIRQSRLIIGQFAPNGGGAFRAREGLALYFSPVATLALRAVTQWDLRDSPPPDEMNVEVVAGPFDYPAAYERLADDIAEELDIAALDDLGMIGPDTDIDGLRFVHFNRI